MLAHVVALALPLALVPTVAAAHASASVGSAPIEVAPAPPPADLAPPPASPPPSAPPSSAPPPADLAPPSSAPPPAAPPPATPPSAAPAPAGVAAPSPAPPPSAAPPASAAPPSGVTAPAAGPPGAAPPPSDPPPADLAPAPKEVVPSEGSAVEVVAPEPEPFVAPAPPPTEPRPPSPPPPSNGRGLLIAAAAVGAIGGVIRVGTSVAVFQANRLVRAGQAAPDAPIDVAMQGAVFHAPMIATAIGLAAGGMARRGRYEAHLELFEGEEAARPRRKRAGWLLLASGATVWTVTRFTGLLGCRDAQCSSRVWEAGYYASLLGTVPGAVMAGYGSGFEGYQNRHGHLADVRLAPVASRQSWGLALTGRF